MLQDNDRPVCLQPGLEVYRINQYDGYTSGCNHAINLKHYHCDLQKLIAYGHFSGNKVDATNTSRRLMDRLVEVVCECFNNGRAEDGVQLQIVKVNFTFGFFSPANMFGLFHCSSCSPLSYPIMWRSMEKVYCL